MSGRDFILPQAAQELGSRYEYHEQGGGPDKSGLPDPESFPYLSLSLKGMTEQLTTRYGYGTHLNPISQLPGHDATVVPEAIVELTFSRDVIALMTESLDANGHTLRLLISSKIMDRTARLGCLC